MKTKHRKQARTKQQQRQVTNAIWLNNMIGLRSPLQDRHQTDLSLPARMAYDALRKGQGVEEDYHTLACVINLTAMRAEKMDELVHDAVLRAQEGLVRMLARHHRLGVWGFDGPALQDIPVVLDVWEQVIALVNVQTLMQDLLEVGRRLRNGTVYDATGLVAHGALSSVSGAVIV